MKDYRFAHLNVHLHYSINDVSTGIKELMDTAIRNMPIDTLTNYKKERKGCQMLNKRYIFEAQTKKQKHSRI